MVSLVLIDHHDGSGFVDRTPYVRLGGGGAISFSLSSNGSTAGFQTADSSARFDESSFDDTEAVFGPAYIPSRDDDVKIYDYNGTLRFSGFVDSVEITNNETFHTFADVKCIDAGVMCQRRRVGKVYYSSNNGSGYTGGTYGAAISDIISDCLSGLGITFAYNALLDVAAPVPLSFPWITAAEAFNRIASALNLDWFIDENKALSFFSTVGGYGTAPVAFDDTSPTYWQTMKIQDSGQRFANRLTLKTNIPVTSEDTTQYVIGSGGAAKLATRWPVIETPKITVNGVDQLVVPSNKILAFPAYTFTWVAPPGQVLNVVLPRSSSVVASSTVVITQRSPFPGTAEAEDADSIASVGLFDYILDASEITSLDEAQGIADAMLARLLSRPQNFSATTMVDGFKPGQLVHISIADMDDTDADFIVQSVSARESEGGFFNYSLTGSTDISRGAGLSAYVAYFQRLLAKSRTSPGTLAQGQAQRIVFQLAPTVAGVSNTGLATGVSKLSMRAQQDGVAAFVTIQFANLISGAATTTTDIIFTIYQNGVSVFTTNQSLIAGQAEAKFAQRFTSNPLKITEGDQFTCEITQTDAAAMDGLLELVYYGQ